MDHRGPRVGRDGPSPARCDSVAAMRTPARFVVVLTASALALPPAASHGTLPGSAAAPPETATAASPPAEPAAPTPGELLAADTPRTTVTGNTFVAPAGWTIQVRGPATILTAPEGDSRIALVDVDAADADAALAAAWAAYEPEAAWPVKVASDRPDRDGWTRQRVYEYQTSPNERRDVLAFVRFAGGSAGPDAVGSGGGGWMVAIYDMSQPVAEKRAGQVSQVFDRLFPKGYAPESFAGRTAHALDASRLAELSRFVETGRQALGIPGVALGVVEKGKVVFADGFGVRELGSDARVDADTLFMVASNTKALTTLLLARLVDAGRITWKTPVTTLLPSFRLGDDATTRRVLVEHLICACTGMPRQDLEMIFEFGELTPAGTLVTLGTMQPTSDFGAMFQYSNPMAGAAGFAAGHVLYPDLELGAAYDRAMQVQVFDPLGMSATTFDYARALAGNRALPHSPDVDGKPAQVAMDVNYTVVPMRPAGAAWSSVRDMLRYVAMELAEGALPDGTRYIGKEALLARRAPQVAYGNDATYGMGLTVRTAHDVTVVHHGGDVFGHHSDMMWLPEHGVGAVILTNGSPGWILRSAFQRKLLEVLFDAKPEADARVTAAAETYFAQLRAERPLLTVPAEAAESAKLAPRYANPALGPIAVQRDGDATLFDFGEWRSEVASRRNPDGTVSFMTVSPGVFGFEFVVGPPGAKRTLVIRDAQHEYVFDER